MPYKLNFLLLMTFRNSLGTTVINRTIRICKKGANVAQKIAEGKFFNLMHFFYHSMFLSIKLLLYLCTLFLIVNGQKIPIVAASPLLRQRDTFRLTLKLIFDFVPDSHLLHTKCAQKHERFVGVTRSLIDAQHVHEGLDENLKTCGVRML